MPEKQPTDDELARAYNNALVRGKRAYERADEALRQLHDRHEPGWEIQLPDGRTITLIDNFAETNVAWKPAGVRRFDAKISKPTKKKATAKAKKKAKRKAAK